MENEHFSLSLPNHTTPSHILFLAVADCVDRSGQVGKSLPTTAFAT